MKSPGWRVGLALALAAAVAGATTYVRKPAMKDLATSWLGGPPAGILEYARLDLAEDGTGIFVLQELPDVEPMAYQVTATVLSGYAIELKLRPAEARAEPIYLKGHATPSNLDLEVGGTRLHWHRQLFLETEARVRGRIEAVTDHARRAAKGRSTRGGS